MDPECVMLYLHSSIRLHGISRDNFYGRLSAKFFQHTPVVRHTFGLIGYGVVGWGIELQVERSRVRFPMGLFGFLVYLILNPSGRTMAVGLAQPRTELTGIYPGGKGSRCGWMTNLPLLCVDWLEILEVSSAWSPTGLYRPVQALLFLVGYTSLYLPISCVPSPARPLSKRTGSGKKPWRQFYGTSRPLRSSSLGPWCRSSSMSPQFDTVWLRHYRKILRDPYPERTDLSSAQRMRTKWVRFDITLDYTVCIEIHCSSYSEFEFCPSSRL